MNTVTKNNVVLAASILIIAMSGYAQAGSSEALASCKKQIISNESLEGYENVKARMDKMQRRGRYTNYTIDVSAAAGDGTVTKWQAECKARDSGRVESLELAQQTRTENIEVATGS